jgi:BirA family biotin operon repressor/biotin-[acetyl-CoA-carboxylase] ligase
MTGPGARELATATDVGARIVRVLHQEPVVSGGRLARELGVSRAAIWKHIEQLRALGYRIEARQAHGYRLEAVPDLLLPAEIQRRTRAARFGAEIAYHAATGSTNEDAMRLARAGAPEGTLVVAEHQTAGRGRLGRTWVSPRRSNLYASFVLRPSIAPGAAPQLALVAGVAVARALTASGAAGVAIKWPNDCLLDGRKVAGILTEMDAEIDRVRAVILGIGVNLNMPSRAFPSELRETATSLQQATGRRVDRIAFTAILCETLEDAYGRFLAEGFGALVGEWEARSCLAGRRVTVECAGRRTTGTVRGLDPDGRLVLDGPEGEERIVAGDVTVVNGYAAARGDGR